MMRCLAAGLLLAALAVSCAPRHMQVPSLDRDGREQRYRATLQAHTQRVEAVQADLVFRARAPERGHLPWVNGRMLLAAPDGLRVVLGSLFGTALDLAARGDTLEALVPKEKLGLAFEAAGDSLGVHSPGRLAYRVLSGVWRPPESAWRASHMNDGLLELRWIDDADSLMLAIGPSGYARVAEWKDPKGTALIARYAGWSRHRGIAWPGRVEIDLLPNGWSVQCRMVRVRFTARPGRSRMALTFPSGYRTLTRADLRDVIEQLGRDE